MISCSLNIMGIDINYFLSSCFTINPLGYRKIKLSCFPHFLNLSFLMPFWPRPLQKIVIISHNGTSSIIFQSIIHIIPLFILTLIQKITLWKLVIIIFTNAHHVFKKIYLSIRLEIFHLSPALFLVCLKLWFDCLLYYISG